MTRVYIVLVSVFGLKPFVWLCCSGLSNLLLTKLAGTYAGGVYCWALRSIFYRHDWSNIECYFTQKGVI